MTETEKQSTGKRGGARGPREPKPKVVVKRESPRKKVSYEIKEDIAAHIEAYARFLTKHYNFAVTPGAVIESLAENIESDVLFQKYLAELVLAATKAEQAIAPTATKAEQPNLPAEPVAERKRFNHPAPTATAAEVQA